MPDIRTLTDLGAAVRAARRTAGVTTVEVARRSGRSRDVLHRLENGQDVSLGSLLAILCAIGHRIEIAAAARPDLAAMQRRFAHLHDDGEEGDDAAPAAEPPPRRRGASPPKRGRPPTGLESRGRGR